MSGRGAYPGEVPLEAVDVQLRLLGIDEGADRKKVLEEQRKKKTDFNSTAGLNRHNRLERHHLLSLDNRVFDNGTWIFIYLCFGRVSFVSLLAPFVRLQISFT